MAQHDEFGVGEWLRDGIAAAKAGRNEQARDLLLRVIEENDRSEQAWLWLSGVVDSEEDRLVCLENVITLNPDNVQARAGIGVLRERGVRIDDPGAGPSDAESAVVDVELIATEPPRVEPASAPASDEFMAADGCVYCGLSGGESDSRCPHCGGRLVTKQFRRAERSPVGYLLHAYWILLASVSVADFFMIGYVWENGDDIPGVVKAYLPYVVGPVVTGAATIETLIDANGVIQVARYTLLTLAVLAVLVALGVFLRRPRAHAAGIALIGLHLIIGIALFMLGFLGYLMAAFRALLTVMLTVFMFNTVDDFSQEQRRQRLVPDRRAVNDADFFVCGREYEKRGMWAKALLHWQRAAAINPARDTYYAAMARAYTRLGRYPEALKQVDEAQRVSRDPEQWRPLQELIVEAQRGATMSV